MNPLKFNLDIMEDGYETCDLMQSYDYNMSFIMTDNYKPLDLTGVIIQIQMQKADHKFIIQTEKITVVGNVINVEIDKDLTRVNGKGKLQIVLVKNNKTFGSWVIKCNIKASAINDNDGQSENKVTITETLVNKIIEAGSIKDELDKSIINGDTKKMRVDIDKNSAQLADIAINVKNFGAKGDGVSDDTISILNALNKIKQTGGKLYFPRGIYLTSPIDLTLFSNVVIQGCNETVYFPYTSQTELRINSVGDVGIKCCTTGSEIPTKSGKGILIENIYLNCNNNVDIGINMNLAVTIKNSCVRYSKGHGLVLEGQSYPIELNKVVSQYNKGHGLYVKAPYTTIYTIYDCEFGFNDLYGVYVEDGSNTIWQNVLIQSNKQGGIKIVLQEPTKYSKPIFLEKFNFINLYTEANGTLEVTDAKYEGNNALVIDSYNTDTSTYVGKIVGFIFTNSTLNKSSNGNYCSIKGTSSLRTYNSSNFTIDKQFNIIPVEKFPNGANCQGLLDLSTNGGQIKFPVVQSPSTDINTLDDYREIDFNFSLSANNVEFTGISNYAKCIKIGRQVTCFVNYTWTSKNNAPNEYNVFGKSLPFDVSYGTYRITSSMELLGSTDQWRVGLVSSQDLTNFRFIKNNNTDVSKAQDFPSSGSINFIFTYIASQ